MNDAQLAMILEALEAAYRDPVRKKQQGRELLGQMIDLSHAHYLPALDFFRRGLDDPDWSWRLDHLAAVGYHYKIDKNSEIAAKIRALLVYDASEMVRMSAASVMARFATWPDPTLIHALEHDEDEEVRKAAFESLLLVMGIPLKDLASVRGQIAREGMPHSIDTLKLIAKTIGKPIPDDL